MKMFQKLSVLAVMMVLAGCNEKISPALQDGGVVTPGMPTPDPGVPVAPEEYYFKVTNTSSVDSKFKLHKAGPNKSTIPCEVRSSVSLSADTFGISDTSEAVDTDISCFFEAEELALHHNGMSFEFSASPNTCEFVGYTPFSFFDRIPGNSSGSFTQVECGSDTTTGAVVSAALGVTVQTSGADLGCNEWASTDIANGTRVKFIPETDAELCRFNYTGGPKCDIGTINVTKHTVTHTPDPGGNPLLDIVQTETSTRIVSCGGAVKNCVKGAIELHSTSSIRPTFLTRSRVNEVVKVSQTLPALDGAFSSNKRYVNYRRELASYALGNANSTFVDNDFSNLLIGDILAKTFTPRLLDTFSSNVSVDGLTELVDLTALVADTNSVVYPNQMYKAVPLAADPYVGLQGNRVNPFYTFYCFDNDKEIKARIRMMVREWDREPGTSNLDLLSDIFLGVNARQDNNGLQPIPGPWGDLSEWIPYNDYQDWDNQIPMARDAGGNWIPDNGWFNSGDFTNGGY